MDYEEKKIELEKVSARNTQAFEAALNGLTKKINDQQVQINGLTSTISVLYDRMNQLENLLRMEKIKQMGTGPSER